VKKEDGGGGGDDDDGMVLKGRRGMKGKR